MAIAFRAAAGKITASTSTNTGVVLPGTVAAGDAMLAVASYSGSGQTLTIPTGWSAVTGPITKGTALTQYLAVKVATGADAGASPLWDWSSTAANRNTEISIYSGTDTSSPILGSASFVETATTTSHVSPTVTPGGGIPAGSWDVEFFGDRGSPSSTTISASGLTTRDSQIGTGGGSITTAVADPNTTITGSSAGGTTWTAQLSSANAILWTVILQPLAFSAPTGLTATPISSSRIDLAWTAVVGATGYNVERDAAIIATAVATNSYSDTGLAPASTHTYRVQASQ